MTDPTYPVDPTEPTQLQADHDMTVATDEQVVVDDHETTKEDYIAEAQAEHKLTVDETPAAGVDPTSDPAGTTGGAPAQSAPEAILPDAVYTPPMGGPAVEGDASASASTQAVPIADAGTAPVVDQQGTDPAHPDQETQNTSGF